MDEPQILGWRELAWRDVEPDHLATIEECDEALHELGKVIAEMTGLSEALEIQLNAKTISTERADRVGDILVRTRMALQHRHRLRHAINARRSKLYQEWKYQKLDEKRREELEIEARRLEVKRKKAEIAAAKERNAQSNMETLRLSLERKRLVLEVQESRNALFVRVFRERYGHDAMLEIFEEVERRINARETHTQPEPESAEP